MAYKQACWVALQHYPDAFEIPIELYSPDPSVSQQRRMVWLRRFFVGVVNKLETTKEWTRDAVEFPPFLKRTKSEPAKEFWTMFVSPNPPTNPTLIAWFASLMFNVSCAIQSGIINDGRVIMCAYADSIEYIRDYFLNEESNLNVLLSLLDERTMNKQKLFLKRSQGFERSSTSSTAALPCSTKEQCRAGKRLALRFPRGAFRCGQRVETQCARYLLPQPL